MTSLPVVRMPRHPLRLLAVLSGAAVVSCFLAWVGFDALAARYIATNCRAQRDPGPPPAGDSLLDYAPGLPAWFAPPRRDDLPMIVMVPGYGGDRSDSGGFAAAMQERGYGILRIDRACDHNSETYGGGPREAAEILRAVQFARQKTDNRAVVLYGFSAGGTEALFAADRGAPVAAVITDSAPSNLLNIAKDWHNVPPWAYALTPHLYGLFSHHGDLIDLEHSFSGHYAIPTLVIQGTGDTDVTLSNGHRLAKLTHGQLFLVPGANHGQSFDYEPGAYAEQATTFMTKALTTSAR